MADMLGDFFGFLYSEVYGIPVWLILIILFFIYNFFKGRMPKEKEFKRMDLEKEIRKDIEEQMKYFSVNPPTKQTLLRIGYVPIGIVSSVSFIKWDTNTNKPKLKKVVRTEKDVLQELKGRVIEKKAEILKSEVKEYLMFKTFKNSLLGKIARILNFRPLFTLVDQDFCKKEGSDFIINTNAQFSNYLGIFIYSKSSKEIISDVAYKISREQELSELVNFTPKMTFLEIEQAKNSQRINELSDLSTKRRKEFIEDISK